MKQILRFILVGLIVLLVSAAGLFGYLIYTPEPAMPALTGTLTKATLTLDGETYTYRLYLPKGLTRNAPLVMVLHGSGQNGAQIRTETGYGFERLADQHGFGVVYPSGKAFDWNDCSKTGDFLVNGHESNDLHYLNTLVDRLVAAHGFNPQRVFATGVSAGGFMALRLALESPTRFRAVAAVSANVPAAGNFKCKPMAQGTSVLLMNGTADPLVPYAGGEVSLLGLFFQNGQVRSATASAEFFVAQNQLPQSARSEVPQPDSHNVQRLKWQDQSRFEVELVTIVGGGHGMPQPYWQRPRLLGPSPMAPNGPELIWQFFARQKL
ncbi:PHB depolymerase family esterase [Rheinheimera texasensis]|uniref:alpha/beta hydrolase family esterase n=1 Tax=Rheinheimera texasensis TaxID=306205 RepID=UPI0032B17C48